MPIKTLRKPLLPTHFSVWCDPPDEAGDEILHVVSERRSLTLKGRAFREFTRIVVPRLDGRHTVEDLQAAAADVFRPEDLTESLELLHKQGVLADGEAEGARYVAPGGARMAPQLNLLHELAPGADLQARLASATVAVIGLGGAGTATALSLGAAGVGTVRCVDSQPIVDTDVYFSPWLGLDAIGGGRAAATTSLLQRAAPEITATAHDAPLDSEAGLADVIAGADFVVCCLDAGMSNLIFKLNRVCLATGTRWIACALAGPELVVGPGMHPKRSACYLCYRMRSVACAGNPEQAFAYERRLDKRKHDEGGARENFVFSANLAAGFVGIEVVKELTAYAEPSLTGRLLTIRLTDLAIERHTVLRKPWCPACFPNPAGGSTADAG
jgi:bacteriocin biosynthesis cyclodehydratase domain-containing protein